MASSEEEQEKKSSFRLTMADGVGPLLKLNFVLGVSSYTITSSGHIRFPCKTFTRLRVLVTLILISVSAFVTFYRMLGTLLWDPAYENIPFARFNKTVELICQFVSNLCPLMLIFIGLFRASQISAFFQEMGIYNAGICDFAEPLVVRRVSRRFFIMHLVNMLLGGCLLQLRIFTSLDPTDTTWKQKMLDNGIGDSAFIAIIGTLTFILVLLKQSSTAYLECFSAALATCFTRVIENLTTFIEGEADKWNKRYVENPEFNLGQDNGIPESSLRNHLLPLIHEKPQQDLSSTKHCFSRNLIFHPENSKRQQVSRLTPGQQICFVIRKMHQVSKMQTVVNRLFGPILAIDFGFTVFMMVLLKYLLIRNMASHITRLRAYYMAQPGLPNYDMSAPVTNVTSEEMEKIFITSTYGWLFFLGFDICFSLRIVLLTVCLGNVYKASAKLNETLSKVLAKAQRLVDRSLNEHGNENRENGKVSSDRKTEETEKTKQVITSLEADTVLAFLAVNSAQPVAFTAGGLLTFSGSTIMLIFSVVISYIVFLLQA